MKEKINKIKQFFFFLNKGCTRKKFNVYNRKWHTCSGAASNRTAIKCKGLLTIKWKYWNVQEMVYRSKLRLPVDSSQYFLSHIRQILNSISVISWGLLHFKCFKYIKITRVVPIYNDALWKSLTASNHIDPGKQLASLKHEITLLGNSSCNKVRISSIA